MKSLARHQQRNVRVFLLWLLPSLYVAGLFCMPAAALDPNRRISQFGHRAWRLQDGFFNGAPDAITQTTDGYLWIGTSSGLLRFDGVRFVPWSPPDGQHLSSDTIISLLGSSDGSLWIGTASGLAHWKNGKLTAYTNAHGHINLILEDRQGEIWMTRSRLHGEAGPLCKAEESTLHCYGHADGIDFSSAGSLAADAEGNLWIGGTSGFTRWKPGSSSTIAPDALKAATGLSGVASIVAAADGSVLVGMSRGGQGQGLERLSHGVLKPFTVPAFEGSSVRVSYLNVDRENTLWVSTMNNGIYRIVENRAEHFGSAQGLSSDSTNQIYQDHEGNLWVLTSRGIDEFHDLNIATFSTAEGLSSDDVTAIVAANNGSVFVGDTLLDVIRQNHVSSIGPAQGLLGQKITSLLEDRAGSLWVGVDNELMVLKNNRLLRVSRPDGSRLGVVVDLAQDAEGDIWALTIGRPQKLARIRNREVVEELSGPQDPFAIAADREDGIWLALDGGGLGHYRGRAFQTFRDPSPQGNAKIRQLITDGDAVLGVSSAGLVGLRNGKFQYLNARNGLPCDNLDGLLTDANGSLWLHAECGLTEITGSELQKWWADPGVPLAMRTFDVLDGFESGLPPFRPNASRAPDGKLWFANDNVVQMIDPFHLIRNTILPPVHIEAVIADRKSYPPGQDLNLPARTRDLEIDYTALSFVAPPKVRFRYRLEGRDDGWQDSGNRRQAFYTDLEPGNYQFRVIACNNDGVWNDSGASLSFAIKPAFYQAAWFRLLSLSLAAATLWLLYLLRLRQATTQVRERLGARLEERERIARELHDTLLQGFQGLMLRFQAVLNKIPQTEPAHPMMEKALERADEVLLEGRERVRDLRDESEVAKDLAADLTRYGKEQAEFHRALFSLAVLGTPQVVISGVRHEVYRIGREALANAFEHAGATAIEVEITYAPTNISLRIRDDGQGIDQEILSSGRTGHWGLSGMRERAQKLGGRLNIWSHAGRGTEIDLMVPARVAYARNRNYSIWQRMKQAVAETGR